MRAHENTRMWPSSVHSLSHLPLIYVVCVSVKRPVFAVCFTHRVPCQKKGPLCVGLTFQQPAVGPSCDLCTHMYSQLPTMPLFIPAHQGRAPVSFTHEPRRSFPHPAKSCHGRLYFWCPVGQGSDLSSFNVTSHIYHSGVRTRNSHRKWASLAGYCGCKYAS